MANTSNVFDFVNETLAQFLAKSVSDGSYNDVNTTLKTDRVGFEATATAIPVAGGQLWSNMVDDFIQAAYPWIRQVATGGGGGGSRLTTTPSPTFGGAPPNFTYSLSLDEIVTINDAGFPGSWTVTLPAIAGATPGQLVGIYLPLGNPLSSLVVATSGGDSVADPTSATEAQTGPGVGWTKVATTFATPTLLVFEAVPVAGVAEWRFRADRSGSGGGGGGGRWDETLAAGPTTNGNDRFQLADDRLQWSVVPAPLGDPTIPPPNTSVTGFGADTANLGRKWSTEPVLIPSVDGSTWTTVDTVMAVNAGPPDDGAGNLIHVHVRAIRRGVGATGTTQIAEAKQIWSLSFGTWSLAESIMASASWAANFRINPSGLNLNLEAIDDVSVDKAAAALIEIVKVNGYPAS